MSLKLDTLKEIESLIIAAKGGLAQAGESGPWYSTVDLKRLPFAERAPQPLGLTRLTSVIDYLKANPDNLKLDKTLVCCTPIYVTVNGTLRDEQQRFRYAEASWQSHFQWQHNGLPVEQAIVYLQTMFERTEDRDALIRLISNVRDEAVRTSDDDGVSQVVTAKTSVALNSAVKIPNPIPLQPYRTFPEIQPQPASLCAVRVNRKDSGGISVSFIEADGGRWQSLATGLVADFLRAGVPEGVSVLS